MNKSTKVVLAGFGMLLLVAILFDCNIIPCTARCLLFLGLLTIMVGPLATSLDKP